MDISRRVLFGAVAGGIVAARKLHATGRVTKTEREVLVEKLMRPIDWADEGDGLMEMRRSGFYRGRFIEWSGWLARYTEERPPGIQGFAQGTWTATRINSDYKDHVPAIVPWYSENDRAVDALIDARRRTLDTLLDLVEGV